MTNFMYIGLENNPLEPGQELQLCNSENPVKKSRSLPKLNEETATRQAANLQGLKLAWFYKYMPFPCPEV